MEKKDGIFLLHAYGPKVVVNGQKLSENEIVTLQNGSNLSIDRQSYCFLDSPSTLPLSENLAKDQKLSSPKTLRVKPKEKEPDAPNSNPVRKPSHSHLPNNSFTFMDNLVFFHLLLFGFVAFVIEPLFYFGCNWETKNCSDSPFWAVQANGLLWSFYADYDVLFVNVPMWLRVMCSIEVFVFGPLYLITAHAFYYRSPYLLCLSLTFSGALFYSTIVYFVMELFSDSNLDVVFLVNIPWSIVPVLLVYRVLELNNSLKL